MNIGAGPFLLTWIVASVLANGIALLHHFTKLRGLDLIGYGAEAGVALHGLFGCAIAVAPAGRWALVALLVALTLRAPSTSSLAEWRENFSSRCHRPLGSRWPYGPLFQVRTLGLIRVEARYPESLPDGLYIFKTHTTNVKIEYQTGFPADNYIPFAVTEFFLRGVSFKKERPILPGNEATGEARFYIAVWSSQTFLDFNGRPVKHLLTHPIISTDWPRVSLVLVWLVVAARWSSFCSSVGIILSAMSWFFSGSETADDLSCSACG